MSPHERSDREERAFVVRSGFSGKLILAGVAMVAVAIQAIRPDRTNPPIDHTRTISAGGQVPSAVSAILDRSCKDCHSNATEWPWYSNIAPVSWVVAWDVSRGRRHLSFSDWADYDTDEASERLDDICEQVTEGEMPYPSYVWLHGHAVLTEDDRQVLCAWASRMLTALGR